MKAASYSVRGLAATLFWCSLAPGVSAQAPGETEALRALDVARAQAADRLHRDGARTRDAGGRSTVKAAVALPLDSDGDGMPDAWENANGLNASDPGDAWLDPDGDGVVNLFEYQLGYAPVSPSVPSVVTAGAAGAMYATLAEALDAAPFGSVIRMAGGTFPVNYMTFSEKRVMIQGGWNATFTARNLQGTPTVLDGQLLDEVLYFSSSSGSPVIILDGLRVIRGHGTFGAVNLLAQGSTWMRSSVVNCVITQTGWDDESTGALTMSGWGDSASDRTVVNTVVAGNFGCGIKAQITGTAVSRWRVINATVAQNVTSVGAALEAVNVFTLESGHLSGLFYNCILWAGTPSGQAVSADNWGNTVQFAVRQSNCGAVSTLGGASWLAGAGMLSVDPLFVSAGSGDFHLQALSPLVDVGDNVGIPPFDGEGRARVTGAGVDLGAYEGPNAYPWDAGYRSIGGGWRRLNWFGDYVPMGATAWIWHAKHGFFYVLPQSKPQDVWLYAQDMGWLWTGGTTYPFLYRASPLAWLWYNGSTGPRWFWNMSAGRWESRP